MEVKQEMAFFKQDPQNSTNGHSLSVRIFITQRRDPPQEMGMKHLALKPVPFKEG